ncbi:FAD dependent oxidoreductase domain-containing protein [Plasmodiophora brassicae]
MCISPRNTCAVNSSARLPSPRLHQALVNFSPRLPTAQYAKLTWFTPIYRMRVVVIGGGCVGLATALRLAQRRVGQVVLVERHAAGVGLECSLANASLLCAAHSYPMQMRASSIVKWSLFADQNVRLEWRHLFADHMFWAFAASALRHWPRSHEQRLDSSQKLSAMAQYGISELKKTVAEIFPEYKIAKRGLLSLHDDSSALQEEARTMREFVPLYPCRVLNVEEACNLEPNLSRLVEKGLKGAVLLEDESTAEPYPVSRRVYEECCRLGVEFATGSQCNRLQVEDGHVQAVQLANGDNIEGDVFVICAGAYSPFLLDLDVRLGLKGGPMPIYPLRGHSLTLDVPDNARGTIFTRPVSWRSRRVYITPLPHTGQIRVAGFGDFGGYQRGPSGARHDRIAELLNGARTLLPGLVPDSCDDFRKRDQVAGFAADDCIRAWSGLRPQSADNVPIVGRYGASSSNLYINSGHGVMGWTSSHGSATLVADLITGCRPALDDTHYSPNRFL